MNEGTGFFWVIQGVFKLYRLTNTELFSSRVFRSKANFSEVFEQIMLVS